MARVVAVIAAVCFVLFHGGALQVPERTDGLADGGLYVSASRAVVDFASPCLSSSMIVCSTCTFGHTFNAGIVAHAST